MTTTVISGKRLYVGEASRPNLLLWIITLNGASLSTDMAQRVVEIRLADPEYRDGWEEEVSAFIETNREKIIGDVIALLRKPAKQITRHSRWATWEAAVLSRVDAPGSCLEIIRERRREVDVEQEEGDIVEDCFAGKLTWLGYDPERSDVFIPAAFVARWFNEATGDTRKVTGVTRTLKQFNEEGRTHRIVPARAGKDGERGFRWVGVHRDATEPIQHDIRERLAKKLEEATVRQDGEDE